MPKRRRLLTPMKKKVNYLKPSQEIKENGEVKKDLTSSTPRGRLKGALLDALDPVDEYEDSQADQTPVKRERKNYFKRDSQYHYYSSSEEDEEEERPRRRLPSPVRQSYVLKLFDRSVDLSQFKEDSPLYPICRAWMVNQPKMNYKKFGKKIRHPQSTDHSVELPGPEGTLISRIPKLLPEQENVSKDNINLNYQEAPPPGREELLAGHCARWGGVRRAWLEQAARVEARYHDTQQLLNKINVNTI